MPSDYSHTSLCTDVWIKELPHLETPFTFISVDEADSDECSFVPSDHIQKKPHVCIRNHVVLQMRAVNYNPIPSYMHADSLKQGTDKCLSLKGD